VSDNCDQCGKTLELSGQKTKRFCNTNCRVLWRYHHKIKPNSDKPKSDPKNVPGIATFKDRNDNVEFGYCHGVLEDYTTYPRGNGIFGYEREVGRKDDSIE
jgi:hypothetical protein